MENEDPRRRIRRRRGQINSNAKSHDIMYWPLGVASVFSPPATVPWSASLAPTSPDPASEGVQHPPADRQVSTDLPDLPLISIALSPSGNLLAIATTQELYIWQIEVMPSYFISVSVSFLNSSL